jgi:hypothetical protein
VLRRIFGSKGEEDESEGLWKGRKMHRRFWSENLKGKDDFDDRGVDRSIILYWMSNNQVGGEVRTA